MLTHRLATEADIAPLRVLMTLAIDCNQREFLAPEQVVASAAVMGIDTQLIADRTYFLIQEDGHPVGCGGWSWRATTYGGDHSGGLRNPAPLDPAVDPARVRAMYTHPDHVRRGIGRMILGLCEGAARDAGFGSVILMGTLSGEPLYRAAGYVVVDTHSDMVDGVEVPLMLMRKSLS